MSEIANEKDEQLNLETELNSISDNIKNILDELTNLSKQVENVSSKIKALGGPIMVSSIDDSKKAIEDFSEQDDSNEKNNGTILIVKHPTSEYLKLLVVLDNLESTDNINDIKEKLNKWFVEIDDEFMSNYDLLYASFVNEFAELILDNNGVSLSAALLDDNKTMALSTVDKRIYSCVNGEIYELALSPSPNYSFINSMLIDNNEYTTIMLLSNGVEEEIEDNKVKIITRKTNRDSLAKELFESTQEDSSILRMIKKTDKV